MQIVFLLFILVDVCVCVWVGKERCFQIETIIEWNGYVRG